MAKTDCSGVSLEREHRIEINPVSSSYPGQSQKVPGGERIGCLPHSPWAAMGIQEKVMLSQESIGPVYSKSCEDSLSCYTPPTATRKYLPAGKLPVIVSWLLR